MQFLRIGDEIIRLDLITHIKEGSKEETLYGRSVRKTADHRYGWLEVHFVSGEVIKIEGEGADLLRRFLDQEIRVWDPAATPSPPTSHTSAPAPAPSNRKLIPHESQGAEPLVVRPTGEHRPVFRHGNGPQD
jgi:hypothetical protein